MNYLQNPHALRIRTRSVLVIFAATVMIVSRIAYPASPQDPASTPAPSSALPDALTLEYVFSYGSMRVGQVTKKLTHNQDGSYTQSMWTRPTGIARAITHVEWQEDGHFTVAGDTVKPLSFSEVRKGDSRAYKHKVDFDWDKALLHFSDGRKAPLTPGLQDQGSIFYLFMVHSPTNGQRIMITNGKDIDAYTFTSMGKETLNTPLGKIDTVMWQRLSDKQVAQEKTCLKAHEDNKATHAPVPSECNEPIDDFTVWVAPRMGNVAVQLRKRKNNQTMTLNLQSATGLE